MIKKIALGICLLMASYTSAQNLGKYSHIVGVQANPLLRQVLSFGNTQNVDNPYLLRYSFRENENDREYSFGIGYSYDSDKDENGLEAINNTVDMRLGFFKVINLRKRVEIALGGDILFGTQNIRTFNIQAFNFGVLDSTISTSKTSNSSFGFGPRMKITIGLTKSLSFGTETNYYFRFLSNKTNVLTQNYRGDGLGNITTTTNTSNSESSGRSFEIELPIALFLIIRF